MFEDVAAKSAVMQTLGSLARPGAIIASNTSYLDLDMLAEASGRAADVIGLHFFAPAHRMRLVEIVRGRKSLPDALNTGLAVSGDGRRGESRLRLRLLARRRPQNAGEHMTRDTHPGMIFGIGNG
ncbi:3-hydroxyacyl-CoA dehydrogenase NAD-binding domain-containing protein [Rhizobium binxianense]